MSMFTHPLKFENAGWHDGERWIRVVGPFVSVTTHGVVSVPNGFTSDGASIPRLAWCIVGHPFSGYLDAAVIHDYLYTRGAAGLGITRKQADQILRDLMGVLGYSWIKRAAFYSAVRVGGWSAYQKRE